MSKYRLGAVALALVAAACSDSSPPSAAEFDEVSVSIGTGPKLPGILTLPRRTGARPPVIVMLSGSGPNDMDETVGPNKPFRDIAHGLAEEGVAALRYDKRTRVDPNVASHLTATDEYVPDALAAFGLLHARRDVDPQRIFLLGHSQGGTFAPKIATAEPRFAGVILLAASCENLTTAILRQLTYIASLDAPEAANARAQLEPAKEFAREVSDPKLKATTKLTSPFAGGATGAYFLDLRRYDPLAAVRTVNQPILILQGDRDYQVTVADNFDRWVTALAGKPDVTTHRYSKAGHLFIDGVGPPSPADYNKAGHVNPQVIADIASWVHAAA